MVKCNPTFRFSLMPRSELGQERKECIPSLGDFLIAIHLATLFLFLCGMRFQKIFSGENFMKPHSKNIS